MRQGSPDYLYRILSFKHLVDLFESRELHFSHPSAWEDPYEKVLAHRRSNAIYAQCWCDLAVSDAMWRIYSPDRTSVRIRTTHKKLEAALLAVKDEANIGFLIQDVEYLTTTELNSRIRRIASDLNGKFNSRRAADALLVKRNAFEHEAEVRVVLHDKDARDNSKPKAALRLPVDPHALIDSVLFDPRADDTFVAVCTYYLKGKLRFKPTVTKSALYRPRAPLLIENEA